jgi:hypothetical protein
MGSRAPSGCYRPHHRHAAGIVSLPTSRMACCRPAPGSSKLLEQHERIAEARRGAAVGRISLAYAFPRIGFHRSCGAGRGCFRCAWQVVGRAVRRIDLSNHCHQHNVGFSQSSMGAPKSHPAPASWPLSSRRGHCSSRWLARQDIARSSDATCRPLAKARASHRAPAPRSRLLSKVRRSLGTSGVELRVR